jgi:hemoglobin-like flavoprotein
MLARPVRALTAREVAGVRATLELAEREREALAAVFYARLFETDPAARKLFTIDMAEQGRKLLEMLDAIADGLDQPASLVERLQELGHRHAGYGVRPEYYPPRGAAHRGPPAVVLGERFSEEARRGWLALYASISAAMLTGAARV